MHGTERQRSSTSPPAHDFRGEEFLLRGAGGVRLQVPAKFGDALVQLAEDNVASVSPEDAGLRHLRGFAHFVRVT